MHWSTNTRATRAIVAQSASSNRVFCRSNSALAERHAVFGVGHRFVDGALQHGPPQTADDQPLGASCRMA